MLPPSVKAVCIIPFRNAWSSGGSAHDPRSGAGPPSTTTLASSGSMPSPVVFPMRPGCSLLLGSTRACDPVLIAGSGMLNHESRKLPKSTTRVGQIGRGLPATRGNKFVAIGRSSGLKIIDRCGRPTRHGSPSCNAGERSPGEGHQGGGFDDHSRESIRCLQEPYRCWLSARMVSFFSESARDVRAVQAV